ncbi:hypothetical protein EYF80_006280 [Liparis tanakae]|uniref:Uncharacterized protein n=1 Tax=Liparis tanakae TaxID=230148 RepID=A0A4Z2IZ80_9TELE|nr:hypothetical protein EYF80_006280 [Liparis tanakae]
MLRIMSVLQTQTPGGAPGQTWVPRRSSRRSRQQTGAWTRRSGSSGSQQKARLQELQGKSRPCRSKTTETSGDLDLNLELNQVRTTTVHRKLAPSDIFPTPARTLNNGHGGFTRRLLTDNRQLPAQHTLKSGCTFIPDPRETTSGLAKITERPT